MSARSESAGSESSDARCKRGRFRHSGARRAIRHFVVACGHLGPLFPADHLCRMVFHMKTTLIIDDTVMVRLKQEAARTGRTMSELVEVALRRLLEDVGAAKDLRPLPSFDSGGALVDVADRESLYSAMEGR